MTASLSLHLRQQQSLVMTPQLRLAIKMLQLNQLEIAEMVQEELETNPLLEQNDANTDGFEQSDTDEPSPGNLDQESPDQESPDLDQASLKLDESHVEDHWDLQDAALSRSAGPTDMAQSSGAELSTIEDRHSKDESLYAYLDRSIPLVLPDLKDQQIAIYICQFLDEAGYLRLDQDAIAEKIGVTEERLDEIILTLQELEPAGLFARSLTECLRLQLLDQNAFTPLLSLILTDLSLLEHKNREQLCEDWECSPQDLNQALAALRLLNPKPGQAFFQDRPVLIEADARAIRLGMGEWRVDLVTERLPKVLVNQTYAAMISHQQKTTKKGQADISLMMEKLQSAQWLCRSLEQRAETILKVASAIVAEQSEFLEKGPLHLKPMILKDIADQVELHESTVSRVTANKYLATPRGLFELKSFFASSVGGNSSSQSHASTAVQERIKNLIASENPLKPLSDDKIVKQLAEQGVEIARRTVTKYRESLGLGSSVQRKRKALIDAV